MKKKEKAKSDPKKKSRKQPPMNKKRLNSKIRKAKEIIALNREAMKNGSAPGVPKPPRWKRNLRIVRKIVFWTLIAAMLLTLLSFLLVRINGGTPEVFGYSIQRVSSGSMEPELNVGDVILSKSVSSPDEVAVGDIITFTAWEYGGKYVTHRVIIAPALNEYGEYLLTTKGDANPKEDSEISFADVHSKLVTKLDFLNHIYGLFLSPQGLLIFIALLLLIYFDEILTLAKVLTGNYDESKDEGYEEAMAEEREKEEQRRREEERREKKRKNPRKYDNTSNRKKKNRKKQSKKEK